MALHHGGRGPGHLSRWAKAASEPAPAELSRLLQEDGASLIVLEDDSGNLKLEESI